MLLVDWLWVLVQVPINVHVVHHYTCTVAWETVVDFVLHLDPCAKPTGRLC